MVTSGVRAACYAILHSKTELSKPLIDSFKIVKNSAVTTIYDFLIKFTFQMLQHNSNDVKVTACDGLAWAYSTLYQNNGKNDNNFHGLFNRKILAA